MSAAGEHAPVGNLSQVVFWHRDLPPATAEPVGEHTLEAASARISGTLAHRDELWDRCREDLMATTRRRLEQEVARLGGDYAHVLSEHIEPRHDDRTGEAWLYGRFTYAVSQRRSFNRPRRERLVVAFRASQSGMAIAPATSARSLSDVF